MKQAARLDAVESGGEEDYSIREAHHSRTFFSALALFVDVSQAILFEM
jgi:hypothetical protein